ncbi:MAG TPA: low temperature requirement protein A [Gaiellaceae bacterium]|jgi:low temperature requirement protein LtrA|nr:low temperature requirement protein A [Gaiellaceae bacterium]
MSGLIVEREHRVAPTELFFDLVFVFAFTQVTTLWLEHETWGGLVRGLLVLAVLWWVWASYAWLTNIADADAELIWAVMVLATAALFVAALAVPGAFGTERFVFGFAFFAVVAAFVGLYALVSKQEPDLLAAVLRMARTVLPAAALILVAAFVPAAWRPPIWALAFVVGFFGPQLGGTAGWRVHPAHFAERHGLIVIIAVGESLGAIGFGARGAQLAHSVIAGAVLGLLIAASFCFAYFDFAAGGIERILAERRGAERVALARDAYTYTHLLMIAGIVLFAFAMRTALAHVHSELRLIPALALCCGGALYLLGFVALRWRVSHRLGRGRVIGAVALALITPIALSVSALVTLMLVTAVWFALHAYELIWWREERARRRLELAAS